MLDAGDGGTRHHDPHGCVLTPILHDVPRHSGSTFGNKGAWAAAVGAVDAAEATKVEKEKDWRHKYTKCV